MDEQEEYFHARVARKPMLEGGNVGVLEFRQELVAEGGVDVTTLVVLLPLFRVLSYELLLVEGGFPRKNGGHSTGVSRADEGDLADKRILRCRQENPKMAVLSPSVGTFD